MERNCAVVYDACVLYPASVRDLLIEIAGQALPAKIFRAKWTQQIQNEWVENLLEARKDLTRGQLQRTCRLMNDAILDSLVAGYEHRIDALQLPDPDDRHVLAAAIECGARVIITTNLKDFPESHLKTCGVVVQTPDEFLMSIISAYEETGERLLESSVRACKQRLSRPAKTWNQYFGGLEAAGLTQVVALLKQLIPAHEIEADEEIASENLSEEEAHKRAYEDQMRRMRERTSNSSK